MTVGVVGLGLMGGSIAKALSEKTLCDVYGLDCDEQVMAQALACGAIAGEAQMAQCDLVFVCLFPRDAVAFMRKTKFKRGAIVADICGVKGYVEEEVASFLQRKGVRYVGTHPMAGKELSGFANSDAGLFCGASLILTQCEQTDPKAVALLSDLGEQMGFEQVTVCSAREHDAVIAYTSQMAHVVSNCYVKSDTALRFDGFSAGSFQDLTRVAKLNPVMWSELFCENAELLSREIDVLITHMQQMQTAILNRDETLLQELLQEGSERKKLLEKTT